MIRKATDEDIKKIKQGDLFLVDEKHNGEINQYEASEDARYNGRRWSVTVKAYTMDARTGAMIANAARAFDDCQIVVGDLSIGRINELRDALHNLSFIAQGREPDEEVEWTYLHTFLHIYDADKIADIMEWLKANGFITYKKCRKGIAELSVLKSKIPYM